MSILKLLADQLDILPGFDPDKSSRGMLSQLLGMNKPQTNPSGVPPIMPQDQMSAPGGANPFQQFAKPRGAFARMLTPNSYDRQYDAGHQNFLAEQGKRFDAQQAVQASKARDEKLNNLLTTAGLNPQQIAQVGAANMLNADETGKNLAANLGPTTLGQGDLGQNLFTGERYNPKTATPISEFEQGITERETAAKELTAQARNRDSLTNEWEARNAPVDDGPDVSGESALRKEFFSQNKGFQEVQRSYDRIVSTDPTNAAGQMSLIFQYMKMMDPGSTVREGEFANAQNTTGIPGQVLNAYNRAARGEYLNPQQVTEFQNQAEALYDTAANEFERSFQTYRATAGEYQFNPERTIPDLRNPAYASPMGGPEIAQISSDEEYDALPSGAEYVGPDGVRRIKP
jgi:hypothetical protein